MQGRRRWPTPSHASFRRRGWSCPSTSSTAFGAGLSQTSPPTSGRESSNGRGSAYHRALAGAAFAGCDVIADHVLSEPWRLTELLALTNGLEVLLVHVTCDLDELERRERHRGGRESGTARAQADVVFAHGDCDLVVDTTQATPEACAARVAALLDSPPKETAFERQRRG